MPSAMSFATPRSKARADVEFTNGKRPGVRMKCAVNDRQTRYVARRESLIFCWQLSEPSSFRRFSRRFGRRPPAKNLAAFIEDFSLVSAAPKLHPVQPSPVDTRSLHLCHTRCLTRRCDLNIAVPPGKLPQAAQRTPKERGKKPCEGSAPSHGSAILEDSSGVRRHIQVRRQRKVPKGTSAGGIAINGTVVIVVIPVARPVVAIAWSVAVNRLRHHSISSDYVRPLWGY
jgi:hypothetical protein